MAILENMLFQGLAGQNSCFDQICPQRFDAGKLDGLHADCPGANNVSFKVINKQALFGGQFDVGGCGKVGFRARLNLMDFMA